jgi:hypothetical protein
MYGFEDIDKGVLTVENVLALVPEIILWKYYTGVNFKLGVPFCATYRIDNTPSFSIKAHPHTGRLIGKDFSTGFSGDIFGYLGMVYKMEFYYTLVKINIDFDLKLIYNVIKYPSDGLNIKAVSQETKIKIQNYTESVKQSAVNLQILRRASNEHDISYWAQYGIGRTTLNMYNVWPVEKLFKDNVLMYTYSVDDPCYAYYFPRSGHLKCYFPKRSSKRFIGNISNGVDIQGYDQCDIKGPGKMLVLTKSMKDCMTLHEFGIEAVAIHGETQRFNPDFIRHVQKYYKKVVSLYDRDESGFKGARYLWKEYGIIPYFIPKRHACKDISDLYQKRGEKGVREFIETIVDSNVYA